MICRWVNCKLQAFPGSDFCDPHQECVDEGHPAEVKRGRGRPSAKLTMEQKAEWYDRFHARQRERKRRETDRREALVAEAMAHQREAARARKKGRP